MITGKQLIQTGHRQAGNWYLGEGYSINLLGSTIKFFKPDFDLSLKRETTLEQIQLAVNALAVIAKS